VVISFRSSGVRKKKYKQTAKEEKDARRVRDKGSERGTVEPPGMWVLLLSFLLVH